MYMSKEVYIGVNSTARKIKAIFIGVNGVARKVAAGFIGVNGVARLFFQATPDYVSGQYQSCVTNVGYIYVSNDFGITWTQKGISESWKAISISSDGKYQTACVYNGYIYRSSD